MGTDARTAPQKILRRHTLAGWQRDGAAARSELLPDDSDLARGTVIDGYEIVAKLADGGMASIYAAAHPVLGRRAAIKVISPRLAGSRSAVDRFVVEARTANQIAHPNVIDVFGYGRLPDGRSYFIMEWLAGETLGARIRGGHIQLGETIEILLQTCDALAASHARGIVHRDIKPDNLFLTYEAAELGVKLLDFGVARVRSQDGGRHTEVGTFVGTPHYCSPEQTRGVPVDERADIYSLGVTAFEMIFDVLPFEGDPVDVLALQQLAPPPRPSALWPGIPASLERLLLEMLDKTPARRPTLARVREVLRDLRLRTLEDERYYEVIEVLEASESIDDERYYDALELEVLLAEPPQRSAHPH